MLKYLLYSILFISSYSLIGQGQLPIGGWEDYLPYKRGKWITESADAIYYATEFSVLKVNKADLNPTFIGKLEGLSDVGIDRLEYDKNNDQLIVIYTNSNIDIWTELEITNVPDIKNNRNIVGSKRIQDVHVYDENSAFLATSFGIVELNLKSLDFGSTIFTDVQVNDITSDGNLLYAATEQGIYTVAVKDNVNIADFSQWERLTDEVGLPDDYPAEFIEISGDRIYTVINEELLIAVASGNFEYTTNDEINEQDIAYLTKGNDKVIVGLESGSPQSKAMIIRDDGSIARVGQGCTNFSLHGIEDSDGRYWFADQWPDFRYTDNGGSNCQRLSYNTPKNSKVSDIALIDEQIFVATGGVDVENGYKLLDDLNFDGIYNYDGENWEILDSKSIPVIRDSTVYNMFQVEVGPDGDNVYFGSIYGGLLEYNLETKESKVWNESNSALLPVTGDEARQRVSGIAFDSDDNMWLNNLGAPRALVARNNEGTWFNYNVNPGGNLVQCKVDENDFVWSVIIGGNNGVLVYNPNRSLEDPTDDQQRIISSSNSEIQGEVNCVAVDLDGQVWVGTTTGPVIFDGGPNIFDSENRGTTRKVLQDSILAILLETEDIRSMAIDGANRKWFGTRNGIFVQSPDGETQIAQFTKENSPLFDNVVKVLEFDGKTGRMYVGTDAGVQVYRTETTLARNRHDTQVYSFPNPVKPEYEGDIYVKGLARDADVKITDLNGKLVYETTALGGIATWNGRDYNGRRAESGVYLVFSTGSVSFDTPEAFVTKILIVN